MAINTFQTINSKVNFKDIETFKKYRTQDEVLKLTTSQHPIKSCTTQSVTPAIWANSLAIQTDRKRVSVTAGTNRRVRPSKKPESFVKILLPESHYKVQGVQLSPRNHDLMPIIFDGVSRVDKQISTQVSASLRQESSKLDNRHNSAVV